MSKKTKKFTPHYYELPPDCPVPSVYGENRNYRPNQSNIYIGTGSGIVVGSKIGSFPKMPVGIPQGMEGNLIVAGANGTGKSRCIAKSTLLIWKGGTVTIDPKGELHDGYLEMYKSGKAKRKPILFDPTQKDSMCYDPFQNIVPNSDEEVERMWDIVMSIYPNNVNELDSFWRNSERNILMASLIYYRELGLNFIEIIKTVSKSKVTKLCKDINDSDNEIAKMYIGDLSESDPKNLASFSCGLRNTLSNLASNPYFEKSFCVDEEASGYFGWGDLEDCNIFIRIPEDKIEQWSVPVRIMFNQLFRYLMRRPDKYSPEGADNIQTLLLFDEFARFGKIELFTDAIATLRSKNVNICIMIQSFAQLDKIYGADNRRIICDNCQYKAIMNVYDVNTQKYFSELIGTAIVTKKSYSDNEDEFCDYSGSSEHYADSRDYIIYPHEFATLSNILFHTPYGVYCLDKITAEEIISSQNFSVCRENTGEKSKGKARILSITLKQPDDTTTTEPIRMLPLDDTTENAN